MFLGRTISIMRIALLNHSDVVVAGVSSIVGREGSDIQVVPGPSRAHSAIDVMFVDPAHQPHDEPARLSRLLADPQVHRVAVLTGAFRRRTAGAFLARGYAGYLSTALPRRDLVTALHAIHRGDHVVAPENDRPREQWPGQLSGLTARESDVLTLIAAGMSNHEIADRYNLSINSVKSYIRGAYRAIGVESRTKAVLWALTHGLHAPVEANRSAHRP
ncbi:DNA-binding response regulator, NarL/FixJ family, contains REC and HTH domains [Nocardioides exalbidus]|uniref:DNA-binding response regulator, NarL/FixJ family, contains REC and HTH domains n=2 Tax=Nocardioides exalbidus TaxID=402596 RepID=A0A1H4Y512_9ACTN|nr:DNA-binding response regulator, NarL/FixJ family, contains REC and HTH domains [Nocardioides exalbidus]